MKRHYDPDKSTPDTSFIKNIDVAHEETDINVGTVFKFVFALALIIVATMFLMGGAMWLFGRREAAIERREPPPTLRAEGSTKDKPVEEIFPEPRLQTLPAQDLQSYREAERQALTTYGWVDQGAGKVRIPIEEAKRLVVERGLPEREPEILDAETALKAALVVRTTNGETQKAKRGKTASKAGQQPAGKQHENHQ